MRKEKRVKTGGRRMGTPNKFTRTAREAFQHAFTALGGAEGLARWATANREAFYRLYARLIPAERPGAGSPIKVIINSPLIAQALAESPPVERLVGPPPVEGDH